MGGNGFYYNGTELFFLTENYAVLIPNTCGKPRALPGGLSMVVERCSSTVKPKAMVGGESYPTWSLVESSSLHEPDIRRFWGRDFKSLLIDPLNWKDPLRRGGEILEVGRC